MNTIRKIISLSITIIIMSAIFFFSAKPADESSAMSLGVGKFIGENFVSGYSDWDIERQEQFVEKIEYPIRKCAHAIEYFTLAISLVITLGCFRLHNKRRILSWAITTIYAATDELHQLFVPGRACKLTDVCIDSVGALLGLVLFSLTVFIMKKIKCCITK